MIILITVILDMIAIILIVMLLLKHISNKYLELNNRINRIYEVLFNLTHSELNPLYCDAKTLREIETNYNTMKG